MKGAHTKSPRLRPTGAAAAHERGGDLIRELLETAGVASGETSRLYEGYTYPEHDMTLHRFPVPTTAAVKT